jgi:arylsulfatase A-like enzyme
MAHGQASPKLDREIALTYNIESFPTKLDQATKKGCQMLRFITSTVLIVCAASSGMPILAAERPNVLFVIVDDLRPELGCYGNREIKTPHFDKFAESGTLFTRAYCQAAACAPSRAAVMTGLRPDTTRVWDLKGKFRVNMPNVLTIPQHFHQHGYHTVSMGKIFHNHMPDRVSFDEADLRPEKYMTPEMIDRDPESFYHDESLQRELAAVRKRRLAKNPKAYAGGWAYGRSTESFEAPNSEFYDGAQTDLALETLKRLKTKGKPFFLALGYYRPHLPFVAPKRYWDLYDRNKISMADNPFLPRQSPVMAMNSCYELRGCYDLEYVKHPSVFRLPQEDARRLKHGYYASVSFVDACFGRLIEGLAELGLDRNTIVVVWGDHGWKLGEHGSWCKQTNYDIDVCVPLLIRVPGLGKPDSRCERVVELLDLYPTLCDVAGIPIPEKMEGVSLKPLLTDPTREWKAVAFSQYHRNPRVSADGRRYMGYSMVTPRYHYIQWHFWDHDAGFPGNLAAIELYDHQSDPDENTNVAHLAANQQLVNALSRQLATTWPSGVLRSRTGTLVPGS